ncbi:Sorbitol dehydrogenase, partial [Pseudocercospora fuligena]
SRIPISNPKDSKMVVGHFPLQNKTCIITGGGSGIGLAFVKLAALTYNCRCLIADLKLTPEAESLCQIHPNLIAFTHCDVTNWTDLNSLPSQLQTKFKSPNLIADIWIAGAGIFDGSSFAYDQDQSTYRAIRINTEHPIKLTRIAMRSALGANKPAVMLIVSSFAGVYGQYASAIYCASKHAVVGFTKSMMQADRDEDFKVVCILPGMVATPLWTGKEAKREFEQFGYDEGQCLSPEE